MTKIKIRGLEIKATHGVHDFEKTTPQRFVFDVDLAVDFYEAAKCDDLSKSVNYSSVCKLIDKITRGNSFDLIEKLAFECAAEIFENFEKVTAVDLTVHKPDAPVNLEFSSVAAAISLQRERAYLSIGSNMGDRKKYLDTAIEKLKNVRGVVVEKVSSYLANAPYGGVADGEFLNCAVQVSTFLSPENLLLEIHRIEEECERVRDKRWGNRTLDIDIIFFGSRKIITPDLVIPHPDWFNRPFVILPLKQIAPDFYCPDKMKYIKDI